MRTMRTMRTMTMRGEDDEDDEEGDEAEGGEGEVDQADGEGDGEECVLHPDWRLKTLSFDATACGRSAAASLLMMLSVSPSYETLQSLRIVPGNRTISFGRDRLSFGRLRCLDLSEACYLLPGSRTFAASCFDANAWSQLLAPSLEHLSFPDTRDIGFRAALAFTESLPKLKQVTAERGISHPRNGDSWRAPHRFLDRHAAQLEELRLGATPLITVSRVLLFADQWFRLSTLRLAIKVPFFDVPAIGDASPRGVSLPADFLMALGSLPALESLYLAVGSSEVWKHQWKPDHALLRSFLGRLTKLRHLAFMLDTYPGMPDNAPMEGYDPPDFVSVCKFLEDKVESENYLDPSKYPRCEQPATWGTDVRPRTSAGLSMDDHKHNMRKETFSFHVLHSQDRDV